METKTFEELEQLKQDGRIGWVEFVQQSEYAGKYAEWLSDRGEEPDEDNAEFFLDMTDMSFIESQAMYEAYGI
jgi:hypothetical protein